MHQSAGSQRKGLVGFVKLGGKQQSAKAGKDVEMGTAAKSGEPCQN